MADIRNEKYIDADQLAEEFLIVNCQVESSEVRQKQRTSEPVRIGEILPDVMADIEKRMYLAKSTEITPLYRY